MHAMPLAEPQPADTPQATDVPSPDGPPDGPIDAALFRSVLGRFATGVAVATTVDGDRPVGVTVNSFASVSLDPPLVLFCLHRKASTLAAFQAAGRFAVNILAADQQAYLSVFSRPPGDWTTVPYKTWDTGSPILEGTVAAIDCAIEAVHDAGDHVVIIGRVRRLEANGAGAPLVYYQGRVARLIGTD